MYDCFLNLVKITSNPEESCIPPEFGGISISGYYVDDTTAGRIPVKAAFFKNINTIGTIIPDAIRDTISLVKESLNKNMIKRFLPFELTIGFNDYNSVMTPTNKNYRFLWIKGKNNKGLMYRIKSIKIKNEHVYLEKIIIIQKDSLGNLTTLYDGSYDTFETLVINLKNTTFFLYPEDQSNLPHNIKHVPCCGSHSPYSGIAQVGSGDTDDLTDLNEIESGYTNGFIINGDFYCDPLDILCSGDKGNIDFTTDDFGILFSKLIQQIARRNLCYRLLTDDSLSSYLLIKIEELNSILDYINSDIEKMLNYIPYVYNHTDCFVCRSISKSSIII